MVIDFEFGQTRATQAFFKRNPQFQDELSRLLELTNKCFGREINFASRAEHICFGLGQACRDDYLEIVFLATNGYSSGAMKLLRGLYERAVALAYIVKDPDKAERFVRYGAVQEHRALNSALKHYSEEEFDEIASEDNTAAKIRERYEMVKTEFERESCRCGRKSVAYSWDIDIASMAGKAGKPLSDIYIGAYTLPNLQVHATLASAVGDDGKSETEVSLNRIAEADFALQAASLTLAQAIRCQDQLFSLGLEQEISVAEKLIRPVKPE